jgi:hypothetical protein
MTSAGNSATETFQFTLPEPDQECLARVRVVITDGNAQGADADSRTYSTPANPPAEP